MTPFLKYEDFKHAVELECPHDGLSIRIWLRENEIPFTYRAVDIDGKHFVRYKMTQEFHLMQFFLRWAA